MTDRQTDTDRKLNVAGLQPTSGVGEKSPKQRVCTEQRLGSGETRRGTKPKFGISPKYPFWSV